MKITLLNNYINNLILILCTHCLIYFISCGIDRNNHYKNAKNYGQDFNTNNSVDLIQSDNNHQSATNNNSSQTKITNSNNSDNNHNNNSNINSIINEHLNDDNINLSFNKKYIGFINLNSLNLIFKNNLKINPLKYYFLRNLISQYINTDDALLNVIYNINLNSDSYSNIVYQKIYTTLGDLGTYINQSSESGTYLLNRTNKNPNCPNVFICIDKMIFYPVKGFPIGFCYYDINYKPSAFPYAPLPNIKFKDFQPYLNNYFGPYLVKIVTNPINSHFNCELMDDEKINFYKFMVKITQVNLNDNTINIPINMQTDFILDFINNIQKPYNLKTSEFIDDILKLQQSTKFYFNSNEGIIFRIIKTLQKSLQSPNIKSHIFFNNIYKLLNPLTGIKIQVDFILCNLLKYNPKFKTRCE